MDKSQELAILVYSCWKNSDMWDVLETLLKKYWKDCKYKIILLTDKYAKEKVNRVFDEVIECDDNWYEMITKGIEHAGTRYVMLWMDDYLLCDYVNNEDIEYFLTEARRYQAANIRLIESPTIKANSFIKDERYNYYEPGTAYSFSTQIGIWDVECLKNYIKPDWSAWDFERKGSLEIEDFEHPLLAPKFYNFPYEEGVRNGKWLDCGVRVCKRNGIVLDFNKRKPMSNFELAWIYFKGGIIECNPNLVLRLQHLFSK